MALLRLAAVALVDGEPDVAIGRDWLVYRDAADVVALVHSETLHADDRRDRRRFVVRVGGVLSESSKGYARLGMSGTVSSSRDTQDAHPCLVQAARRCDCDLRSVGGRARRSASRSQCSARAQRVFGSGPHSLDSAAADVRWNLRANVMLPKTETEAQHRTRSA